MLSHLSKSLSTIFADGRVIASVIFLSALFLRIIFAVQWYATPYGAEPLWDARGHDDLAIQILNGHFLQKSAFYSSPLFPYVLALAYKLFGHNFVVATAMNLTFDSLTCAILSLLAIECFGPRAGICTGILSALCRPMIFYTAPVMKESLGLFLLAIFLFFLFRGISRSRVSYLVISGMSLGICALVRGNALVLIPVAALIIFFHLRLKRYAIRYTILFSIAAGLSILPATLHNFIASRDFVLVNYDGGFNFYLGNSPTATGVAYDFPDFITSDPRPEEIVETEIARKANDGRTLLPSEVSHYWEEQALQYILANPMHAIFLFERKIAAFWNNESQFDNYDINFIRRNFGSILSWPLCSFGLISSLAIFSAIGLWPSERRKVFDFLILGAAYMVSVLMFYVTDRYRLPIVIFILPLAGAALQTFEKLRKDKSRIRIGYALLTMSGMALISFWPRSPNDLSAYDWGTLGSIEADLGHYQESVDMVEKGYAISPSNVGEDGMIKASYAEEKLGHIDQAKAWLSRAETEYPANGAILYNIGRIQAEEGFFSDALSTFKRSLILTPTYVLSYFGEAVVEEHMGQIDKARLALKQGLDVDPSDMQLQLLEQRLNPR